MAESASGQDEPILSAREYLLCPARKDCFNNMINPLLTKLVCSRRLGTSLVLFYVFMGLKGKTWPISSHIALTHA